MWLGSPPSPWDNVSSISDIETLPVGRWRKQSFAETVSTGIEPRGAPNPEISPTGNGSTAMQKGNATGTLYLHPGQRRQTDFPPENGRTESTGTKHGFKRGARSTFHPANPTKSLCQNHQTDH